MLQVYRRVVETLAFFKVLLSTLIKDLPPLRRGDASSLFPGGSVAGIGLVCAERSGLPLAVLPLGVAPRDPQTDRRGRRLLLGMTAIPRDSLQPDSHVCSRDPQRLRVRLVVKGNAARLGREITRGLKHRPDPRSEFGLRPRRARSGQQFVQRRAHDHPRLPVLFRRLEVPVPVLPTILGVEYRSGVAPMRAETVARLHAFALLDRQPGEERAPPHVFSWQRLRVHDYH